jgi:indole-3-glycerol phosphate synthase
MDDGSLSLGADWPLALYAGGYEHSRAGMTLAECGTRTVEGAGASVLHSILEGVREGLAQRQREVPLAEFRAWGAGMPPALDPRSAFRSPGVSIIAEVKRKSPSKGALADIPDPASLAGEYEAGGADVIGINAQDLTTLEVDRSVFADLVPHVPDGTVRVAESAWPAG